MNKSICDHKAPVFIVLKGIRKTLALCSSTIYSRGLKFVYVIYERFDCDFLYMVRINRRAISKVMFRLAVPRFG